MKIFLDTANVTELREGVAMGLVDGCTTNPSLIAKEKQDRKSTRLNSSHSQISYAVFCLKKKKHLNQLSAGSIICHKTSVRSKFLHTYLLTHVPRRLLTLVMTPSLLSRVTLSHLPIHTH